MMLYNNSYTYKAASSCLIHTVATNWGWKWMPIALAINKLDSNRTIISFTLTGIGGDQYRFAANSIHARFSPRYATIWPFLRPSNNNLHGGDTHLQLSATSFGAWQRHWSHWYSFGCQPSTMMERSPWTCGCLLFLVFGGVQLSPQHHSLAKAADIRDNPAFAFS